MVRHLRWYPVETPVDPADAFVTLFGEAQNAVWLDAGPGASAGRSYLAASDTVATEVVAPHGREVVVSSPGGTRTAPGTMVDFLRDDLAAKEPVTNGQSVVSFALGWVGWLGYESGAAASGVPVADSGEPAAAMLFVDRALVFDHERGTVELLTLEGDGDAAGWVAETRRRLATASGAASGHVERHAPAETADAATWRHDDEDYLALLRSCQESIRAGDAYQLCLTNRASARVDRDPLAVHLRLREASPAHHGGLVRINGVSLVSSSPEQFLSLTANGRIRTKPIKGTRPRGATIARDVELRAELEASEKERAENVMIVDLMRNDLGRVCEVGSVGVRHLLAVESYPQVHQLVSTVEGTLLPGLVAADAIAACFPAGSMTGAPKLSAMRILHALEGGPRGIYAGCFGYLGLDGAMDLAMVIRSVVVKPGLVSIGAGGGITALSVPEEELEEVAIKARALLAAAGLQVLGNGQTVRNV
ncbi:aminodeoxychorismate synthase component I [Leifsonia poae]|uniref:aminodeoxychorismate synthase component I n=1 Tax=Leifsonia poae TaxID=110933 RepID=UPI001CBF4C62|nr:aminodeoxychorismate synthase component I [Leifsonia poae]